jgi:hypothetical protein
MAKFKFEPIARFWAPVKIVRPDGAEQEFEAEFVYLDDAQWAELGTMKSVDFLARHWTGWRGVVGADDRELPFSEAQRDQLLSHSYITTQVIGAYVTARQGVRAKN